MNRYHFISYILSLLKLCQWTFKFSAVESRFLWTLSLILEEKNQVPVRYKIYNCNCTLPREDAPISTNPIIQRWAFINGYIYHYVCHFSSATSAKTTNFEATRSSTCSKTHFPFQEKKIGKLSNQKGELGFTLYWICPMAMTLNLGFSSRSITSLASSNVKCMLFSNPPIPGIHWIWSLSVIIFLAPEIASTIDA